MYYFDNKFKFLDAARSATPPFAVTPDLEVPEGTVALLFLKEGTPVPNGISLSSNDEPLVDDGTKIYLKHATLEMGAGVFILTVGTGPDHWTLLAVDNVGEGFEDQVSPVANAMLGPMPALKCK